MEYLQNLLEYNSWRDVYFKFQNRDSRAHSWHSIKVTKTHLGMHHHTTILQIWIAAANDWGINFDKKLIQFTTDSRSNIVKVLDNMKVSNILVQDRC